MKKKTKLLAGVVAALCLFSAAAQEYDAEAKTIRGVTLDMVSGAVPWVFTGEVDAKQLQVIADSIAKEKKASVVLDLSRTTGITKLAGKVFKKNANLARVYLPETIAEIDRDAFSGCANLVEVRLPSQIKKIAAGTFENCKSLASIDLPSSIESVGKGAFAGCSSLAGIVLPSGVKSLGDGAFEGCAKLRKIEIPVNCLDVGDGVFAKCALLESASLPDRLAALPKKTFKDCKQLSNVSVPLGVTELGNEAFSGSGITEVSISEKVEKVGGGAFSGCSSLVKAVFLATKPPKLGDKTVFARCSSLKAIYVPAGSVNWYKDAENWNAHANVISEIVAAKN